MTTDTTPSTPYVWAGSNPFTGQQVLDLLNENESLRQQLEQATDAADTLFNQHESLMIDLCKELDLDYEMAGKPDVLAALTQARAERDAALKRIDELKTWLESALQWKYLWKRAAKKSAHNVLRCFLSAMRMKTRVEAEIDALRAQAAPVPLGGIVWAATRLVEECRDEYNITLGAYMCEPILFQDLMKVVDELTAMDAPAQGWRLLEVGEEIQMGDEMYLCETKEWSDAQIYGVKVKAAIVRRRVALAAQRYEPSEHARAQEFYPNEPGNIERENRDV